MPLYDLAGRPQTLVLPGSRTVSFTYDDNGNLATLTPPGQPAHVFRYTAIDLENEYEPPVVAGVPAPKTVFTYNIDRQLEDIQQPGGRTIDLVYETTPANTGRLDQIVIGRGTYDLGYSATTGALETITAPNGMATETLTFGYDGELLTSTAWSGTVGGTVSQTFDNDFRIATETAPGDPTALVYAYDDDGLLTAAGALTLVPHADHGLLEDTALGSVTTHQTYNGFGELAAFTATYPGGTYSETATARDKLGRIEQRTETVQGVTTTYDYEYTPAGQLWKVYENSVLTATYGYDANGNRTSLAIPGEPTITGTPDAQDRLVSYGDLTFTYTANGELETRTDTSVPETTSYTYDELGNVITVTLPSTDVIDYVIDGRNRRVGKKVNGALVQGFLYRDQLNPVVELDGTGAVVSRFVYGAKPNVPDYMVKSGTTYRILSDHLGSVRLVVDAATGAIAQRIDYDEFGNPNFVVGSPDFQPFAFAGGLYDADTRLTRFGARDYDPVVGRWTAKDPIRFSGGDTNLFGYTLNDPINLIDPAGLFLPSAAEAAVQLKIALSALGFGNSVAGAAGGGLDLGGAIAPLLGLPECGGAAGVNALLNTLGAFSAAGLGDAAAASALAGGAAASGSPVAVAVAVGAAAAAGFEIGSAGREFIEASTGVDIGTAIGDAFASSRGF